MALGTSPRPCWTLSGAMTAFHTILQKTRCGHGGLEHRRCVSTRRGWRACSPGTGTSGWARHSADDRLGRHERRPGATIAGLPALHLAFLMATGAAAAALTLIHGHDVRASVLYSLYPSR